MSIDSTSTESADKQPDPDPFALTAEDKKVLQDRCISIRVAEAAGLRHYPGKERAESKRWCKERKIYVTDDGLPFIPVDGIVIPHGKNDDGSKRYRVRLGETSYEKPVADDHELKGETETVQCPRYWIPPGTTVGPYVVARTKKAVERGEPIYVVEAPLKALSLISNGYDAIGLGGVMAGAHDKQALADLQEIVAHPQLRELPWHAEHRNVITLFDAGQTTNPQVALGVAYVWAGMAGIGVNTWVSTLPENPEAKNRTTKSLDQGPDDFLARSGKPPLADVSWSAAKAELVHGFRSMADDLAEISSALGDAPGPLPERLRELATRFEVAQKTTLDRSRELTDCIVAIRRGLSAAPALDQILDDVCPADPVWRVQLAIDGCQNQQERSEALRPLLRDLVFVACLHVGGQVLVGDVVSASSRGFKTSDLKAALGEFRQKLSARRKKADEEHGKTPLYEVVNHSMVVASVDYVIADFEAKITNETVRIGTREEGRKLEFEIEGTAQDGTVLPTIEVTASDFQSMKWPETKWGTKARIRPGKARDMVRDAIMCLSEPARREVYDYVGWRDVDGDRLYMLPGGAIGEKGRVSVDVEPREMDRFACPKLDSSPQEALEHVLSAIHCGPDHVMGPLLLLPFLAPLRPALGAINFTTWLVGPTGSHKSTAAALPQSFFGTFDYKTLPNTWDATITALEDVVHRAGDVVYTIDNYIPPGDSQGARKDARDMISKVVRFIQNVGDGQSRSRANRDAVVKPGKPCRATPLATGEILPPDNESTLARCFVVELRAGEFDLKEEDRVRARLPLLNEALGHYVQWLHGKTNEEIRDLFVSYRDRARNGLRAEGLHDRSYEAAAMLLTAGDLLCRWATDLGMSIDVTNRLMAGVIDALRVQPKPPKENTSPAGLWLAKLSSMVATGAVRLRSSRGESLVPNEEEQGQRFVGWLDGEEILIELEAAYSAVVRDLGQRWYFNETSLRRSLSDHKIDVEGEPGQVDAVTSRGEGNHLMPKRACGGERQRVLVLDRRALNFSRGAGLYAVPDDDDDDAEIEDVIGNL